MLKTIASLMLISIVAFGCDKDDCPNNSEAGIIGKWNVTESYSDPGNGSGTWQPTQGHITFNADSSFTSSGLFDTYKRYTVKNDSVITFLANSLNTRDTEVGYKIEGKKLTLTPPCIEWCGIRLKRDCN